MAERLRRERRRIFLLLTLMYVLVYFYRVSLAVVADDIALELKLTPRDLGLLSSILLYVYAVAQLPLGPVIDRAGSRLVISFCGVLAGAGGILFSFAHGLPLALAARVLIGLGTASVLMATFTIFSHWYSPDQFGRASSLVVACGNLGNLSATTPLAFSAAAIGWRSSFLVIALLQLLLTALVFLLVRDRPAGAPAQKPGPGAAPGIFGAWREICQAPGFLVLAAVAFFQYGNYLALQGLWGGPYLMQLLHLSRHQSGQLLLCSSLGAAAGALCVDFIARSLVGSYKRTLVGGQFLFMLLMTGFLGGFECLPYALVAACFFTMGLVSSTGVLCYPIVRAMFPVDRAGTALTSINFFILTGAAVTQQVMGALLGALRTAEVPVHEAFHAAFLLPIFGLCLSIAVLGVSRGARGLGAAPPAPSQ